MKEEYKEERPGENVTMHIVCFHLKLFFFFYFSFFLNEDIYALGFKQLGTRTSEFTVRKQVRTTVRSFSFLGL